MWLKWIWAWVIVNFTPQKLACAILYIEHNQPNIWFIEYKGSHIHSNKKKGQIKSLSPHSLYIPHSQNTHIHYSRMDEEHWLSHENACWPRTNSSLKYNRFTHYNVGPRRSKAPIWRQIWRKFRKEKKRIFGCSNSMRFTYDPHSYSQNFDQGPLSADDHHVLLTSFSARFAVPSRIFDNPRFMV